jgi:twitching motility protein PilT
MDLEVFDNWVVKPPPGKDGNQKKTDRVAKKIRCEIQGNHSVIQGETVEISPKEFLLKITDDAFLMPEVLAAADQCRAKIEQEFAYGIGIHFPTTEVSYNGRITPDRDPKDVTLITCTLDTEMDFDTFLKLKSNGIQAEGGEAPDAPGATAANQGQVAYEVQVTGGRKAFKALALNLTDCSAQILITDKELRMPEGPGKSVFINKIITDHFIKGMSLSFKTGDIKVKGDPMGVNEVKVQGKPCTVIECNFRQELTPVQLMEIKSNPTTANAPGDGHQPAKLPAADGPAQPPGPKAPEAKEQAPPTGKEIPLVQPKQPAQPAAQAQPAQPAQQPAPPPAQATPAQPAAQPATPAAQAAIPQPAAQPAPQAAPAQNPALATQVQPAQPAAQPAPPPPPQAAPAPPPPQRAAPAQPAAPPQAAPQTMPTVKQTAPVRATAAKQAPAAAPAIKTEIREHMMNAAAQGATDLHIKAGRPMRARIGGEMVDFGSEVMTPEQTSAMAQDLMSRDQGAFFQLKKDVQLSCAVEGAGRFRVSILRQQDSTALAIRCLQQSIPTVESLGLEESAVKLAEKSHGLVLVTGPAGAGKSTTLAAMVDHINRTRACHILTLEGPIEYVHTDAKAQITQREVGRDALDYSKALISAMYQDPDVILVSDILNTETFSYALNAAESGRLVLASLNAFTPAQALARLFGEFHPEVQAEVRIRVAEALQGILIQNLVRGEGGGLTLEQEVLTMDKAVGAFIRENKLSQITDTMKKRSEDAQLNGMGTSPSASSAQAAKNMQFLQAAQSAQPMAPAGNGPDPQPAATKTMPTVGVPNAPPAQSGPPTQNVQLAQNMQAMQSAQSVEPTKTAPGP